MKQGRFKHITQEQINELREWVYNQWKLYLARATNFQNTLTHQAPEGKENDNRHQGVNNSMIVLFFTVVVQ